MARTFCTFLKRHLLSTFSQACSRLNSYCQVLSIAKSPCPLQLILVISVETGCWFCPCVRPTWHATKPKILPRIVSIMGPKSCHRTLQPQHTNSAACQRPDRVYVLFLALRRKKTTIFSWPLEALSVVLTKLQETRSPVTWDQVQCLTCFSARVWLPGKVIAVSPRPGRSRKTNTLGLKG